MKDKKILRIALITLGLLIVPFIASQVSSEFNWTTMDFVFAWVMWFGAWTSYELLSRRNPKHKLTIGIAVLFLLAFIWVGAATGFRCAIKIPECQTTEQI